MISFSCFVFGFELDLLNYSVFTNSIFKSIVRSVRSGFPESRKMGKNSSICSVSRMINSWLIVLTNNFLLKFTFAAVLTFRMSFNAIFAIAQQITFQALKLRDPIFVLVSYMPIPISSFGECCVTELAAEFLFSLQLWKCVLKLTHFISFVFQKSCTQQKREKIHYQHLPSCSTMRYQCKQ